MVSCSDSARSKKLISSEVDAFLYPPSNNLILAFPLFCDLLFAPTGTAINYHVIGTYHSRLWFKGIVKPEIEATRLQIFAAVQSFVNPQGLQFEQTCTIFVGD